MNRLGWIFLILWWCCPNTSRASSAGTETLVGIVGPDFVLLGADSSVSQSISLTASNLDKIAVLVNPFPRPKSSSPFVQQTIVAAAAGNAADADRLLGILAAEAAIQEFETSVGCDVEFVSCNKAAAVPFTPAGLSVNAVARLARHYIASSLRSATPLQVCLLVAGMVPAEEQDDALLDSSFTAKQVQMQVDASSQALLGTKKPATRPQERTPQSLQPRLFWLDEYGSLQRLQYGAHGFGSNFILSILDQGYRADLTRPQAVNLLRECFAQLRMRYVINSPQPPCIKCIDANGCQLIR